MITECYLNLDIPPRVEHKYSFALQDRIQIELEKIANELVLFNSRKNVCLKLLKIKENKTMSRFNKRLKNIQHFKKRGSARDINSARKKIYTKGVCRDCRGIYMSIFRHNTKGEYVIETMPYDKDNWKVYRPTQTKEEALLLIKGDKNEKDIGNF